MLRQHWKALCIGAVAEAGEKSGSTWALLNAECSASSTTCSADFSRKGEHSTRIDLTVVHQTDDDLKAEIVAAICSFGHQ